MTSPAKVALARDDGDEWNNTSIVHHQLKSTQLSTRCQWIEKLVLGRVSAWLELEITVLLSTERLTTITYSNEPWLVASLGCCCCCSSLINCANCCRAIVRFGYKSCICNFPRWGRVLVGKVCTHFPGEAENYWLPLTGRKLMGKCAPRDDSIDEE